MAPQTDMARVAAQSVEQTYAVLREHNATLQLVVILSPVPLTQTFADESLAVRIGLRGFEPPTS